MTNFNPKLPKWLSKVLGSFVDAINERTIRVSDGGGIDLTESTTGVLLALSTGSGAQSGSQKSGGGLTADQLALIHALENPITLTPGTFVPWKDGATSGWLSIDVMDTSCTRRTIAVWSGG